MGGDFADEHLADRGREQSGRNDYHDLIWAAVQGS